MAFIATKDNDGKRDPAIWSAGRQKKADSRTKKEIREAELLSVARKIKSHVAKAIMTSAKILDREEAKDSDKIAASKLILTEYLKLIDSVYLTEDETEVGQEVQQQNVPTFSLHVLKPNETKEE